MRAHAGRNDPCPCGSGKKYKHCYGKNGGGCSLHIRDERVAMLKEHNEREKFVLRFFNEVLGETTVILLKTSDGHDQIPLRVQMIVSFSVIDMLASYWYEYRGITGKTNERAHAWYDRYCRNEKNPHYKGLWQDITSERLYKFRNALVHFFGLGEEVGGEVFIALGANDTTDELRERIERGFSSKGKKTIVVRPADFYNLIREGALLMLEEWQNIIAEAQTNRVREEEYIAGIKRVWGKIQKEGAVRVDGQKK